MTIINNKYIFLNADDEFPDCMKCDGCTDCDPKFCGPENGWNNYRRKIRLPELTLEDQI